MSFFSAAILQVMVLASMFSEGIGQQNLYIVRIVRLEVAVTPRCRIDGGEGVPHLGRPNVLFEAKPGEVYYCELCGLDTNGSEYKGEFRMFDDHVEKGGCKEVDVKKFPDEKKKLVESVKGKIFICTWLVKKDGLYLFNSITTKYDKKYDWPRITENWCVSQ